MTQPREPSNVETYSWARSVSSTHGIAGRAYPRNSCKAERRGEGNEHLDNFVRNFADCVDHWILGFPCGRRTDSPAARVRGDFLDLAFRNGKQGRLIRRES